MPTIPDKTHIGQVMNVTNAAKRLGVYKTTVYKAIRSGRLKAFKAPLLGETEPETVIRETDLEEYRSKMRADSGKPRPRTAEGTEQTDEP